MSNTHSWKLVAAVGLGLLGACTAEYPRGAIVCSSDPSDCPEGMRCRLVGDSGEGRCYPEVAGGADAGVSGDAATANSELGDAAVADDAARVAADGGGGSGGTRGRPPSGGVGGAVVAAPGSGGTGGQTTADGGAGGRVMSAPDGGGGGAGGRSMPAAGSGSDDGMAGQSAPAAGSGGAMSEPEPCADPARACDASEVDTEEGACGACDSGSRTRTRKCNPATCQWQAWGAWSTCAADTTKCTPGSTETRTASCPHCGAKTQTRTCSTTTCTFGAWTDASACSWCDDCAHVEWCDTPDDVAKNRGTWCWPENGCNSDQAWGRCQEILKELSCQVHQPVYTGH